MKKLFAFLAVMMVALSSVLSGYAADGKVTYSGNAQQFIFAPGSRYSPTDLFPDFKDVMPGDSLTQKITLKNDASNEVKVKIYLRSLGAQEDSAAFLSQLGLQVRKSDDNEMGYMFDAAADETATLTDWVCLGTLYAGGEVDLDVTLTVPVTLSDEYQDSVGYLDWEFMVEEFPMESSDPKPPKTGAFSQVGMALLLVAASLITLAMLFIRRKVGRQPKKNEIF